MALSAQELAQWQADASAYVCDQPCVLQHKTATQDGLGSPGAGTYTTYANTFVGLSEPTAGQLQNYAEMVGDEETYQAKFPIGTNVLAQDLCIVGGLTLKVHILLTPRSYATLETVLCAVIK